MESTEGRGRKIGKTNEDKRLAEARQVGELVDVNDRKGLLERGCKQVEITRPRYNPQYMTQYDDNPDVTDLVWVGANGERLELIDAYYMGKQFYLVPFTAGGSRDSDDTRQTVDEQPEWLTNNQAVELGISKSDLSIAEMRKYIHTRYVSGVKCYRRVDVEQTIARQQQPAPARPAADGQPEGYLTVAEAKAKYGLSDADLGMQAIMSKRLERKVVGQVNYYKDERLAEVYG